MGAELRPEGRGVLDVWNFIGHMHLRGRNFIVTEEGGERMNLGGVQWEGVVRRLWTCLQRKGIPVCSLSGALEKGYRPLYGKRTTAAFSTWKSGGRA